MTALKDTQTGTWIGKGSRDMGQMQINRTSLDWASWSAGANWSEVLVSVLYNFITKFKRKWL